MCCVFVLWWCIVFFCWVCLFFLVSGWLYLGVSVASCHMVSRCWNCLEVLRLFFLPALSFLQSLFGTESLQVPGKTFVSTTHLSKAFAPFKTRYGSVGEPTEFFSLESWVSVDRICGASVGVVVRAGVAVKLSRVRSQGGWSGEAFAVRNWRISCILWTKHDSPVLEMEQSDINVSCEKLYCVWNILETHTCRTFMGMQVDDLVAALAYSVVHDVLCVCVCWWVCACVLHMYVCDQVCSDLTAARGTINLAATSTVVAPFKDSKLWLMCVHVIHYTQPVTSKIVHNIPDTRNKTACRHHQPTKLPAETELQQSEQKQTRKQKGLQRNISVPPQKLGAHLEIKHV